MIKIFGREPTLVIQTISAALSVFVAVGVPNLSAEQAALIIGVINAVFGVLNAVVVRPIAPAAFTGLIAAGAALLGAYGLELSQELVGTLSAFVITVLTLLVRGQVSPVSDPRPADHVVG